MISLLLRVSKASFFTIIFSILLIVFPFFSLHANFNPTKNTEYGELEDGYYLVVGVFSVKENASDFNKELRSKGYTSDYAFSPTKKLHYCYILRSDSLKEVKDQYNKIVKVEGFSKAWILRVHDKEETKIEEAPVVSEAKPTVQPKTKTATKPGHPTRDITATHHVYKVFVNLHDSSNHQLVAHLKVVGDEGKVLSTIKPHHEATIHIPKNGSQTVLLTCDAFGYHKTELGLPLGDLIALKALKNVKVDGQNVSIDLEVEPLEKGDMMVMPNVLFHPNSNIMRSKSEDDLNTLLRVMTENPNLKIIIHGHTNGSSSGPITKITESCDNFFDPKETVETKGSSVKLSELRAEAVKLFLMKNGIAAERIQVKGWGGKKMIYKEDSPQYQLNVRVEIEVTEI